MTPHLRECTLVVENAQVNIAFSLNILRGALYMQQDYELFIRNIRKKTGIDLSRYKEVQMKRRLKSLYERKGFYSFKSFYDGISRDSPLLDEFLDRMTY